MSTVHRLTPKVDRVLDTRIGEDYDCSSLTSTLSLHFGPHSTCVFCPQYFGARGTGSRKMIVLGFTGRESLLDGSLLVSVTLRSFPNNGTQEIR